MYQKIKSGIPSETIETIMATDATINLSIKLLGVITVIVGVIVYVSAYLGELAIGILIGIVITVPGLGIFAYLRRWAKNRQAERQRLEQERLAQEERRQREYNEKYKFVLERHESIYQYYEDRQHMRFIVKKRVQALVNGLTRHKMPFNWTGHGACDPQPMTEGYTLGPVYKDASSPWNFYDVIFPKELAQGEIAEFETEMALDDIDHEARTFLGTTLVQPTELLIQRVILPPNQPPQSIEYQFWPAPYDPKDEPKIREKGTMDRVTGEIRRETTKPELKSRYAIAWSWDETPPVAPGPGTST